MIIVNFWQRTVFVQTFSPSFWKHGQHVAVVHTSDLGCAPLPLAYVIGKSVFESEVVVTMQAQDMVRSSRIFCPNIIY